MPEKKQKNWNTPKLIRLLRPFGKEAERILSTCKGNITTYVAGPNLDASNCTSWSERGYCPSWVCMEMRAS